jgi:isopenicillin-N epimerase
MLASMRENWLLDPSVAFLNHGSFGACPRHVLDRQTELRARLEREPIHFFMRELEPLLDRARSEVAEFVGASAADVAFVRNATAGANAVLRSLVFSPGDELLTTDHAYAACKNALDWVAMRSGIRVVVAKVPFPLADPSEVVGAIAAAVTPKTRLAMIDHVTSPTGLVWPVDSIVRALAERGVDVLVDGAHAPGMLDLNLDAIGAAYYVANFHKWTCSPKGAGMLYVRRDKQRDIHPTVISHGLTSERARSKFLEETDWTGTDDPTSWLCVPEALRYLAGLVPGGWPAIREKNHALAMQARGILCRTLDATPPAPESMIGSLVAIRLPAGPVSNAPRSPLYVEPLQTALFERHRVEVPIMTWPSRSDRLVRVSAALYNERADYERLASALVEELARERG